MKQLTFLEPEIAEKIEELTANLENKNPIAKLVTLKNVFDMESNQIWYKNEWHNIYDEDHNVIKKIINEQPEQLLLHFATYDPQHTSHAAFVTPISENFDCVTYIRKHNDLNPTAVASVLKRKDSDIEFDLTLIDTYDLDSNESYPPGVKSYLYGNPYDEDWQHVEKTNFSSIDDIIENNK